MPSPRSLIPRPFRGWFIAGLAGMAILSAAGATASPAAADLQRIAQADWTSLRADGETPATGLLPLPDHWGERGVPRPGEGRYTLSLDLSAAQAAQPWALWSARFPLMHRVRVNGALVSDTWTMPSATQPYVTPLTVHLPPAVLRPGANRVEIDERGGQRAGLGTLLAGPATAVDGEARVWRRWTVDLPRVLNGAAAGGGLFALLLWLRRRQAHTLGWFGALSLVLALRNIAYVEGSAPAPSGTGLLLYAMTCVFAMLSVGFVSSLAGGAGPWLRRASLAVAATALGFAAWAGHDTLALDLARRWVYLLTEGLVALSLAGAMWRQRQLPWRGRLALPATLAVLVGCGGHDYLLHNGWLPHTHEFLIPWLTPLLTLAYVLSQGAHLTRALEASEQGSRVLEQRVRERTRDLEAANEAKTRFLAAASHDLRQPLAAIGLLSGVLREQLQSPAQQRLAARLDESVGAMATLLDGLLDLSRLDADTRPPQRHALALAPLVATVLAQAAEPARQRRLALRHRVPTDATVLADAALVEQILRNLVSNAVRYTDQGGVLVTARRRGAQWLLQVWDTGRGIATEHQTQVFDDFVQLDNPQRTRQQGLGLGLAIVRRAAARLQAPLSLRSVPGQGSCFGLGLPAGPDMPMPRAPEAIALPVDRAPAAAAPASDTLDLAGRTVWVVDDDDAARGALALRLAAWGATVHDWASPAALQAALAQGHLAAPALLVTDMRLPGEDGLAVAARVRAAHGAVPVLVVTGNTAPADLAALSHSGLPLLHKPLRSGALAAAVGDALCGTLHDGARGSPQA